MQRNKLISIITIICFGTIIFIPIGLALMWLSTQWKTKLKIIISSVLTALYIVLVALLLLLEPANNYSGLSLPINYQGGQTSFETSTTVSPKKTDKKVKEKSSNKDLSKENEEIEEQKPQIVTGVKKGKGKPLGRGAITILFFLLMFLIILWQNYKFSKAKKYENPYVDTDLYVLPLSDSVKLPIVHFLKLPLYPEETIYFATETNQKGNEGNLIITNKRVVIQSVAENTEFPLNVLEAVSSISSTVIQLTSGTRKYYIYMDESQVKYALAIIRWAYKKHVC